VKPPWLCPKCNRRVSPPAAPRLSRELQRLEGERRRVKADLRAPGLSALERTSLLEALDINTRDRQAVLGKCTGA
jgi:hypothetical protein